MRLPLPLLAAAGLMATRAGRLAWRFRLVGEAGRPELADGRLEGAIYALWHEYILPLSVLHAGQGAAVLTSRHRDGEVLSRVLRRLGYLPVRGSTTGGGAAGLRALLRAGREGRPLAVTPDGPRGPRRRPWPGVARASAATGLPVVPVGAAATSGWRLESWDRFLVPAPGAVVFVSYGPPMTVPRRLRPGDLAAWTGRIGEAIDREIARCEARAARPAGPPLPSPERAGERERGRGGRSAAPR